MKSVKISENKEAPYWATSKCCKMYHFKNDNISIYSRLQNKIVSWIERTAIFILSPPSISTTFGSSIRSPLITQNLIDSQIQLATL